MTTLKVITGKTLNYIYNIVTSLFNARNEILRDTEGEENLIYIND